MTESQKGKWFASWFLSRGMNSWSETLCNLIVKPNQQPDPLFSCSRQKSQGAVVFLITEIGRAGTRSQPFLLQILFSFYYTTKWKYFLIVALDLKAKASEKPGYFDEIMGIIL